MENRSNNAAELVSRLAAKGVKLWTENDKIKYKAGAGALGKEDIAQLKEYKQEVIDLLNAMKGRIRLVEDRDGRYEPFVLTDVQQSYLMGRKKLFDYGGVACHIYLQLDYDHIDVARAEEIWNKLIAHHEMLRAVVHEEGYQQIMEKAPHFTVTDLGDMDGAEVMAKMGHSCYQVGSWPYFSVAVTNYENSAIMHFSIEFLIADWTSIWLLLLQFEGMYFGRITELPEIGASFRDYVIAERELKAGAAYESDKKYWLDKLEEFPPCPHLDVNKYDPGETAAFDRKFLQFTPEQWAVIKRCAVENSVTPTALVLMIYSAVLERYSENKRFAINLTVLGRQDCHKDINKVVGDFTSLVLLDVDLENAGSFSEAARMTNALLFEDMDHGLFSGVSFMRELSRKKGNDAAFMPYVFTSAIGLLNSMDAESLKGMVSGIGISQTPQVFIDCQVMDGPFGMQVNWDIRRNVFKEGMTEDMFGLFGDILNAIADGADLEAAASRSFPAYQGDIFAKANDTAFALPEHLLHEKILSIAEKMPEKTAVVADGQKYTYRELIGISGGIAEKLKAAGFSKGEPVGLLSGKSVYQPAGAIAVLAGGGVYVPISAEQGANRISSIISRAGIKLFLTVSTDTTVYPESVVRINMDEAGSGVLETVPGISLTDQAYIIFTSGSTGEPKGVVISHGAAVNTIEDINRRCSVGSEDSVLGVSQLNFDLSVYDIFGLLSVGGTLVYPEDSRKKEPSYLAQLIAENGVTVWNSVPSLLKMVMLYMDADSSHPDISTLRLVMLSGDWIPLDLPDQLLGYSENALVVSLGGATEASIWSNYHEYHGLPDGFASIPYGLPLANQQFRVLDSHRRNCPVGVKGELYILGKGLADGYCNDPERTAEQFIKSADGVMMYRTGDLGKYHRNGEIEFLGRMDSQIKLNGHRIELQEIAHAVDGVDKVNRSVVVFNDTGSEKSLVCFYVTESADESDLVRYDREFAELAENIGDGVENIIGAYASSHQLCRTIVCGAALSEDAQDCTFTDNILAEGLEGNSFDIAVIGRIKTDADTAAQRILEIIRPAGAVVLTADADKTLADKLSPRNRAEQDGTVICQVKTDRAYVSRQDIAEVIRNDLTDYMIPKTFLMLDSFPVTANGKVDMKKLRSMAANHNSEVSSASDSVSAGTTETQNKIIAMWAELGITGLGITDNFFDHGADSLIMAQITGKLRKELAPDIAFDEMLRFLLNHPNVGELAEFIDGSSDASGNGSDENGGHIGTSQLIEAGEGALRVVFHPAMGNMSVLRELISNMTRQNKGNILTISVGDYSRYCELDDKTAVSILADDYTQLILETGCTQVQLIGYSFGGWLATQCAVRLVEAGVEIADLVLLDPQTIPWDIENELITEMMFLPNAGVALPDDGTGTDAEAAFAYMLDKCGKIPENAAEILLQSERFAPFGRLMEKLGGMTKEERFSYYTSEAEKNGSAPAADMLMSLYGLFSSTTRYTKGEMEPYFGDVRYINAADSEGLFFGSDKNIAYWSDICIGDMEVLQAKGGHFTAVADPENAAAIAELL